MFDARQEEQGLNESGDALLPALKDDEADRQVGVRLTRHCRQDRFLDRV